MKDVFEDLIQTIERNAVDNKATIENVKLWADSWRKERDLFHDNTMPLRKVSVVIDKESTLKDCIVEVHSNKHYAEYRIKEMLKDQQYGWYEIKEFEVLSPGAGFVTINKH